jgi:hypothetical protein
MAQTAPAYPLPPGTENLLTRGFNGRTYEFDGDPVFAPTYAQARTIQLPDQSGAELTYSYPDHVTWDAQVGYAKHLFESSIEYESDYANTFGGAVTASGKDGGFSISGETDFTYTGEVFQDESKFYEVAFLVVATGGFHIPSALAPVDPAFATALDEVLAAPSPGAWSSFFDRFGTHCLVTTKLGGFSVLECVIDKSVLKTTSSSDVHASFTTGYDASVASGSLSATAFEKTSSLYQQNQSSMEVNDDAKGGVGDTVTAFVASCRQTPIPLFFKSEEGPRPTLVPLSELAPPGSTATMEAALETYLANDAGGTFGAAGPYQSSVAKQIDTDAIVLVTGRTPNDSLTILSDASADPGTVVAKAGVAEQTKVVGALVRAGDYLLARTSTPGGDVTVEVFPCSIPNAPATLFGQATPMAPTWADGVFSGTAPSDGFLVMQAALADTAVTTSGYLDAGGATGLVVAYAQSLGGDADAAISMIMPLLGGKGFGVSMPDSPVAQKSATFTFLPLIGGYSFGAPAANPPAAVWAQAQADSICTVAAYFSGDVTVSVADTADAPAEEGWAKARFTVGNAAQSVLVPIPSKSWYRVDSTAGEPPTICLFPVAAPAG